MFQKIKSTLNNKLIHKAVDVANDWLRAYLYHWDDTPGFFANRARDVRASLFVYNQKIRDSEERGETWSEYTKRIGLDGCFRGYKELFRDTKADMAQETKVVWTSDQGSQRLVRFDMGKGVYFYLAEEFGMMGWQVDSIPLTSVKYMERNLKQWGDRFWETYGGIVTLNVQTVSSSVVARPEEMVLAEDRAYVGPYDADFMDEYIGAFEAQGFSRSLLFEGPPGTGKSTVSFLLAKKRSGRALHLNRDSIESYIGKSNIRKVLEILRPSVMLLDDIHLMGMTTDANMLNMLEWINEDPTMGTLMIATSNDLGSINKAMSRPGRFDEVVVFREPDAQERRKVIDLYADLYDCTALFERLGEEFIEKLVFYTEGLTQAFVKDLVKTIKSVQFLEGVAFQRAVSQRLIGMLIAARVYRWDIDREAIDISQPLPTEKILKKKMNDAERDFDNAKDAYKSFQAENARPDEELYQEFLNNKEQFERFTAVKEMISEDIEKAYQRVQEPEPDMLDTDDNAIAPPANGKVSSKPKSTSPSA